MPKSWAKFKVGDRVMVAEGYIAEVSIVERNRRKNSVSDYKYDVGWVDSTGKRCYSEREENELIKVE